MNINTDERTKLMFGDLNDPEQVKGLFLWLTEYETTTEDILQELAGMFLTLRKEIKESPIFGIDFCDRALDALYLQTLERDKHAQEWADDIESRMEVQNA